MRVKKDLTEGSVGRQLFRMSLPMVFGVFSLMAFNLIDTFFVAQLGTRALAAISFTFPVVWLVGSISMGLGTAVGAVVSRAIGGADTHKAKRMTTHGLILSFIVVAFFAAIGLATIATAFAALGADEKTLPLVEDYMRIWYVGMFFLVIPMVGNSAIRATGDTKLPALIMIIAASINLILDPLLIFGLAGFPRLELKGAAIATVIARAVAMLASLIVLQWRKRMLDFSLVSFGKIIDSWKHILYIGIPSAITNMFVPISSAILTRLVAAYGVAAVAAVGAGVRVEAFALMVIMAVSTALMPFVGQNSGAKQHERVQRAQGLTARFSLIWGGGCVAFFMMSAPFIARIFSQDSEVIQHCAWYLWIVPLCYGLRGIRILSVSLFNALNKPLKAAALNMIWMFLLYLPLALLGSYTFGLYGIFAGVCLAHCLGGCISFLWARRACVVA